MKKVIIFLRSLLFSIGFISISFILSLAFMVFWLPFFPNRTKNFDFFSSLWCKIVLWILKTTTGIKSNVLGYDRVDPKKSYLIVAKHESTWDTLILHTFMSPPPVFIVKKELLLVPFFGWCLALSSKIAIDRNGGASTIKQILKEGKQHMEEGHSIIIFPQGTRVPPYSTTNDYPYKAGFVALVKELGADVLPVALNSGKLWEKKQFLKYSGTITLEFLEPIKYEEIKEMNKEDLIKKLKSIIETKSKELNEI